MAIDKSNPNTRRLIEHWVRGEGAAQIRWGTDGSFDRCVTALGGKVRDPEGLCAELHKEATGEWPAEEGTPSSLDEDATFQATRDDARVVEPRRVIAWEGDIAPSGRPTGDGREFAAGSLGHRTLPLPAMFQAAAGAGHSGAVTVASLEEVTETPTHWVGRGQFLDPRIVPEVTRAIYLLQQRLAAPSVDLEPRMTFSAEEDADTGETTILVTQGTIVGVTFVAKPAFSDLRITVFDAEVASLLASAGIHYTLAAPQPEAEFGEAVDTTSWRSMPLGARDQTFDADDAISRLIDHAGGNAKQYSKAFLWRDPKGDPKNRDTYRLPIADVINGDVTLVPHAVYAAAALLSGAHGGLPNVPDEDKEEIREVVTSIYDHLRETFSDPRIRPMWQRGGRAGAEGTGEKGMERQEASLTAAASALHPRGEWLENPNLASPTPLRVTEEGRVYGHLASWGVCHTGIGDACVMAPRSRHDYRYFLSGYVVDDASREVRVGKITLGGGHAHPEFGHIPALEHYDQSGTAVAIVAAGEDQHGIWVAGCLVPGVSEEKVFELRHSPLSGDWRLIDGHLELIAALAVNTPGYPVIQASAGSAALTTILAAGVVPQESADINRAERDPVIRLAEIDRFMRRERLSRILED